MADGNPDPDSADRGHVRPLVIVGLSEIAMRAGVQKPAVSMWRTRHPDFPQPLATLRIGHVWLWADVEDWLRKTGRPYDEDWTLEQINSSSLKNRKPMSWG